MGNTTYRNLNLDAIIEPYEKFIGMFKEKCSNNNITLLVPKTLRKIKSSNNLSSVILDYTFYYISPAFFYVKILIGKTKPLINIQEELIGQQFYLETFLKQKNN